MISLLQFALTLSIVLVLLSTSWPQVVHRTAALPSPMGGTARTAHGPESIPNAPSPTVRPNPPSVACGPSSQCPDATATPSATQDQWVDITPLSPVHPPALAWATMDYDFVSSGIILFGGFPDPGTGPVAYTWEYKSYTWTNLTPNLTVSPPARYHAAMAETLSPLGLVLFGGQSDGTTFLGDTWYWNGSAWTQEDLAGSLTPAPRAGASFAYEYTNQYNVLFGGTDGTLIYNDTWVYQALAWHQLHPGPTPPGRYFGSAVWSENDTADFFFGGATSPNTALSDSWMFSNGKWTQVHPANPPSDRLLAGATEDFVINEPFIFGGFNPENCTALGDTWGYSTGHWGILADPLKGDPAPSPRDGVALSYDGQSDYQVLFGGETGTCSPLLNVADTWIYGPWTGPPPSALSATLSANPPSGPAPLATTLTVQPHGGVPPYTMIFSFGDGAPDQTVTTSGWANVSHTYDPSQNYMASATVSDGSLTHLLLTTVISVGSVMVGDWLPPRDTYKFVNYGSYWSGGGNCYGISSTEILYWGHDIRGWGNTPYLPNSVASTSVLNPTADTMGQLNATTLAIMQHQTLNAPGQLPWYYWSSSLSGNWQVILGYLKSGDPVMMGLGWSNLHAVVAYGEQQLANGTYYIDISDPNDPLVTTHAWYEPGSGHFLYAANGLVWNGFDYLGSGTPEELQPGWYGPFLAPSWNFTNYPISSYGYYFVAAGQSVSVSESGATDYFTAPGNSQTFVQGIPATSGIEEGSVQVYALPVSNFGGPSPTVQDPAVGPSIVQILSLANNSGAPTLHGFSVSIDSLGSHDFTLQPSSHGFLLTMVSSTNDSAWANVSLYGLSGTRMTQLNVSLLPIASGTTANFTVADWADLNSTVSSALVVTITTSSGAISATYQLRDGQVGWSAAPPGTNGTPAGNTGPTFLTSSFLLGVAVGAGVVLVAVIALLSTRRRDRMPPSSPTSAAGPAGRPVEPPAK